MRVPFIILTVFSFISHAQSFRYVALGDSYTIGTGVNEKDAWPSLLENDLNKHGLNVKLTANPARNGYTTQDLIDEELPVFKKSNAQFVTLLIGVNDWVRGVSAITFQNNLVKILDILQQELPDKNKILLITIPDFGVTPTGQYYANGRDISKGISEFNMIIKSQASLRHLSCVDIFEVSKAMGTNPQLVAQDGLHPSEKEHIIWEKLIFPEAKKLLGK